MVAKCANPSCDHQFRYLHRGRLFLVDQPPFTPESEADFHDEVQRSEYFWLCESCCQTMTITSDKSGHAVIALRAHAMEALENVVADPQPAASRK